MHIKTSRLKVVLKGNAIEAESFRRIAHEVDLSRHTREEREVIARIIHSCADPSIASTLNFSTNSIHAAIDLLRNSAPIITDTQMVRHALYAENIICALDHQNKSDGAKTRSQLGIEGAAKQYPYGAIFVIGCAPTALMSLLEMADHEEIVPGAIIALPVGYVGAAESKAKLSMSRYDFLTNSGARGGSAMTAAAFNAIARMAADQYSFESATAGTDKS